MPFDRWKPYNSLPLLPPPAAIETKPVLPKPTILIRAISLLEAELSSEIKTIVTSHDALYRASCERELAIPQCASAS